MVWNAIKDQVLRKLRKIAHAGTIDIFNQAVNDLKKSALWKADHAKLKQWFENTWLGIKEVFSIMSCNAVHDVYLLQWWIKGRANLETARGRTDHGESQTSDRLIKKTMKKIKTKCTL